MKPVSQLFSLALFCTLVVLLLGAWQPVAQAAGYSPAPAVLPSADEHCNTGRTVQVSGAAVVNVTPDRALIQLGVQSNGETPQATLEANSRDIQRVIDAVLALN